MTNKRFGLLFTGLAALAISFGTLVGINSSKASQAEALPSNNIVYLNTEDTPMFFGYIYINVSDNDGHSMENIPMHKCYGKTGIYRCSLPNDYSYTNIRFFAKSSAEEYENTCETPWNLKIPTDSKNVFILDHDKSEFDPIDHYTYCADGEWGKYTDDLPGEGDGYYLVSSTKDWKFSQAIKLGDGTHGDKKEILNYSAKAGESFQIRSLFSDEEKTYGDNYEVGSSDRTVNIFLTQNDEFVVDDYVLPPEFVGFYISGTFSGTSKWTYFDSIQMSEATGEYIAKYRGLEVRQGDQIRIRSFSYDRHPWEIWGFVSANQDVSTFGKVTNDNFEFTTSGTYDVFVKEEDGKLAFYVFVHADEFTVDITCVFFDGKTKAGMEFAPAQQAYINQEFTPEVPDKGRRYYVGAYYDEECTFKYKPTIIESNCRLYLKYVTENYYAFTGKLVQGAFNIQYIFDTGIKMNNENLPDGWVAEIYLEVQKAKEEYMFGLFYHGGSITPVAGTDEGHPFVGYSTKTYNYVFNVPGTYHVVIANYNRLYIYDPDGGLLCNNINSTIKLNEKEQVTTSLKDLKNNWSKQKEAFNRMEDKTVLTNIGFKYTENPKNIYEEAMNKYYLAIDLYGSEQLENYIFPEHDPVEPHPYPVYYTITFDADGGISSIQSMTVEENTPVLELPTAAKEGYIFVGWYDAEGNRVTSLPNGITGDITLTAHWEVPKSGCGGNVVATSVVLSALAGSLAVVMIIATKKRKAK